MKNVTTKLMIAAAALVVVAGTASAQTMEAKIPFAFRASGKMLEAGTYHVQLRSAGAGGRTLVIATPRGVNHVLTITFADGPAKAAWQTSGDAVLSFQCGVSTCALTKVWMGSADLVYSVPKPRMSSEEPVHTAEIAMHNVKGD
jgi:hypothetical protein